MTKLNEGVKVLGLAMMSGLFALLVVATLLLLFWVAAAFRPDPGFPLAQLFVGMPLCGLLGVLCVLAGAALAGSGRTRPERR